MYVDLITPAIQVIPLSAPIAPSLLFALPTASLGPAAWLIAGIFAAGSLVVNGRRRRPQSEPAREHEDFREAA